MPLSERKQPEECSKSQLKRDMLALQKLGEALIALPKAQLEKIALPEDLLEAIHFAHSLKSNSARRRHLQYVGKLMRRIDPAPIHTALARIKAENKKNIAQFHEVEKWRAQLIEEGDVALQKLLETHPQADRQQLRQLVRNAHQDRTKNKNTGADKELFKVLCALLKTEAKQARIK